MASSSVDESPSKYLQAIIILCFGIVYIIISSGLIAFNKYLIHPERFPFAVSVVLCHAGFSSVMASLLFLVMPSLFPSLTSSRERWEKGVVVDVKFLATIALPIAFLFSGELVLSNAAYLYSSTAFLQMLKESNLVLVYLFALVADQETFTWTKARILVGIIFATMLTIEGELRFSLIGFLMQAVAIVLGSSKIVLQAIVLTGTGKKLDPLSFVLVVMPLCFCMLAAMIFIMSFIHPVPTLRTPSLADIQAWWPMLLANSCVAFALNVMVAVFVRNSSAVSFILAGITKDAFIVLAGGLFLGELVSGLQIFAFSLQLVFLGTWSIVKMFPEQFENGVFNGLLALREGQKDQ